MSDACTQYVVDPPRRFHPIRSIEFSPHNVLSSKSFRIKKPPPYYRRVFERFIEVILQEGKP